MEEALHKRFVYAEAVREIQLLRFQDYREFLKKVYECAKAKIKPFSYLQFAQDLGLGHNNVLRLIIVGQRDLTPKNGRKISEHLPFDRYQRKYWLALIEFNNAKSSTLREQSFRIMMNQRKRADLAPIDESRLAYFASWHHPVIRELAQRPDFECDPKWIQDQLTIPLRLDEIKKSIELLTRLGLIYYSQKEDRWTSSDELLDTGEDARGMAYVGYHLEMLEQAKQAIAKVQKKRRALWASTLCMSVENYQKLMKKTRELIEEASRLEQSDKKKSDQVVQLNIQLFPFTKNSEDES